MSGTIGRYQLHETLGTGGFATVFRAHDPTLDRVIAIKVLHPHIAQDPDLRQRFVREGRALARVHHPNLVQVFDAGESDGRAFIAMEFVPGQSLDVLCAGRRMPLRELLPIIRQVAGALDAVHKAGLVHRDVKPANVRVTDSGRAVLLDLGIAHDSDATKATSTGMIVGTASFLAPEQIDAPAARDCEALP
jgi:serine/threonine-protein kinase